MGCRSRFIQSSTSRVLRWRAATVFFSASKQRTPSSTSRRRGSFSNHSARARSRPLKSRLSTALFMLVVAAAGCRQDMHDQPKYTAYRPSDFFADRRSARPAIEGTVAQGHLFEDELLNTGRAGGQPSKVFPFAIDDRVMQRGRQRYDIYCSPCHGLTGEGDG